MGFDITGLGSVFDFGSKIIDKIFPDKTAADKAKFDLLTMQQQGELKGIEQDFELMKSQIAVNAVEAQNASLFVSGWRPGVGWVCVTALFYNYVFMPLLSWSVKCFDATAPAMISLDMGELMTLLIGMLGLGGMRMVEKLNNVASK